MRTILLGITAVAVLATTAPVTGHHAFGAEFDPNAPIRLQGKVVKLEWVNPHAWIHIEIVKDGTPEVWMVEGGTPNTLLRRGLSRDSLTEADRDAADWSRRRRYPAVTARGVRGPRSLANMVIKVVADNIGSVGSVADLEDLPPRLLWRIWRFLEAR